MKEEILKLFQLGLSYGEIAKEVGCSKSTVAYHCNPKTKEGTIKRNARNRLSKPWARKLENYKNKTRLKSRVEKFQCREKGRLAPMDSSSFDFCMDDVLEKFGMTPTCYLTGRKLDMKESDTYSFDHIIPASRGGDNSFSNLGITCQEANQAKFNLTVDEFLSLCKEILEYNGFEVKKLPN